MAKSSASSTAPAQAPVVQEKAKRGSKKAQEVAAVAVEVSAPAVVAPAPVKEKRERKPRAPKVVAEVPASTDEVVIDVSLGDQVAKVSAKMQQLSADLASTKSEFKLLEKRWAKELKTAQRQGKRKKREGGNSAPSGFTKPTRISDELAAFLNKPLGTEMARTDVTKEINQYVKSNNLKDAEDGRKILPDAKLTTLLKLGKDDKLTFFNLQRFMKHHYPGSASAAVVA
jgi:chromatin remodeling complex protein RSC6